MSKNLIIKELQNLFYPNSCLACNQKLLPSEECLCLQCLHKLPRTNNFKTPDNLAETLLAGRFPFERVATFCLYSKQGILQPLIHQLKYKNNKEIGLILGRLFGKDLLMSDFIKPIDYIVPVPLHSKKLKKRGYNQAEIIADGISQSTKIPVSNNILFRSIHNPTQTKKTKNQRWDNVKDIFDITDNQAYSDKHILLIDDVITTGSTLEACAHALLKSSKIRISIATLGEVF